ncbi:hypothetical protein [Modestobacter sp. URMC 112]
MSARAASRSAVRGLSRAAVVPVALLAALAVGVAPAVAAPGLTVPLDPTQVDVLLFPVENYADVPVPEDGAADSEWYTPVEVEWGGAVVVQVPSVLDAADASVTLLTGASMDDEPTRTLSTDADGPEHLDVTDLGDGALRVGLPDDPTGGPVGILTVDGLTASDPAVVVTTLPYLLGFTGLGTSAVTVEPQLGAFSALPCPVDAVDPAACTPYPATAGGTVTLTVPDGSPLRSLGLGRLDDVEVALVPSAPADEYDSEYDRGYSDGYEAGYTEAHGEGYGEGYGAGHGQGYSETDEGYDAGYADGQADGRSDGSADQGTSSTEDPAPVVASLADVLTSTAGPAGDGSPASAMAAVTEVVTAVGDVADLGTPAAAPAPGAPPAGGPDTAAASVAAAETDAAAGGVDSTDTTETLLTEPTLLPVSGTASDATVTLPADTAPGAYELVLIEGDDPLAPSSVVVLALDVAAAPVVAAVAPASAAPAAPVVNVGLRSETGWEEERPASPLVAVGAAALVVAALGTVAVLRPRRRDGLDTAGGSPLR